MTICFTSSLIRQLYHFATDLYDVEILVTLLTHVYTRQYCIPFQDARAENEGGQFQRLQKNHKLIGYHSNVS